jgi:hypothetical protein
MRGLLSQLTVLRFLDIIKSVLKNGKGGEADDGQYARAEKAVLADIFRCMYSCFCGGGGAAFAAPVAG